MSSDTGLTTNWTCSRCKAPYLVTPAEGIQCAEGVAHPHVLGLTPADAYWNDQSARLACHDLDCKLSHGDRLFCDGCDSWIIESTPCPKRRASIDVGGGA